MVASLFPSAINKAAALRILNRVVGAAVKRVEQLRRLKNTAIQITYTVGKTLCSTFLSAKAFEQDALAFRRQGAASVSVKPFGAGSYQNYYHCQTEGSDRSHTVKLLSNLVFCECEDSQRSSRHCKHCIAVVKHLGFDSVEAYVQSITATKVEMTANDARASIFAF